MRTARRPHLQALPSLVPGLPLPRLPRQQAPSTIRVPVAEPELASAFRCSPRSWTLVARAFTGTASAALAPLRSQMPLLAPMALLLPFVLGMASASSNYTQRQSWTSMATEAPSTEPALPIPDIKPSESPPYRSAIRTVWLAHQFSSTRQWRAPSATLEATE